MKYSPNEKKEKYVEEDGKNEQMKQYNPNKKAETKENTEKNKVFQEFYNSNKNEYVKSENQENYPKFLDSNSQHDENMNSFSPTLLNNIINNKHSNNLINNNNLKIGKNSNFQNNNTLNFSLIPSPVQFTLFRNFVLDLKIFWSNTIC